LNGNKIGDFFMSESTSGTDHVLPFEIEKDEKIRIQLIYDNDTDENGQDRNVIIHSMKIAKK
jgi:hypothetical protein